MESQTPAPILMRFCKYIPSYPRKKLKETFLYFLSRFYLMDYFIAGLVRGKRTLRGGLVGKGSVRLV